MELYLGFVGVLGRLWEELVVEVEAMAGVGLNELHTVLAVVTRCLGAREDHSFPSFMQTLPCLPRLLF